ncbi:MAG: hypothetical protein FJ290_10125 [Planctomycetes bacterium]|nr:hypothetical protein [Planctomycetota bacterium]
MSDPLIEAEPAQPGSPNVEVYSWTSGSAQTGPFTEETLKHLIDKILQPQITTFENDVTVKAVYEDAASGFFVGSPQGLWLSVGASSWRSSAGTGVFRRKSLPCLC